MTVKEVLEISAKQLGEQDALLLFCDKAPENTEYAEQTVKLLKQCYDLVTDEIACEFLPLKTTQRFNVNNNKILFSTFSKVPLKIVCITDENLNKCAYKVINDYLSVQNGVVEVTYEYRPEVQTLTEYANFVNGVIGAYVLCFGINAEFCFARGRYGESEKWREKFLSGIKNRIANKSAIKIPSRSWY